MRPPAPRSIVPILSGIRPWLVSLSVSITLGALTPSLTQAQPGGGLGGTPTPAPISDLHLADLDVRCSAPLRADGKPLVVVLHGQSGYAAFQSAYDAYLQRLSRLGLRACALSYYRDDDEANMHSPFASQREAHFEQSFDTWVRRIEAATTQLQNRSGASRTGLLGFSQGGALALAVAAAGQPRFEALVTFYAPWPRPVAAGQFQTLPPSLFIHGEADRTVPAAHAHRLLQLAQSRGTSAEIALFPEADHGFDLGSETAQAQAAQQRAQEFLVQRLTATPPPLAR